MEMENDDETNAGAQIEKKHNKKASKSEEMIQTVITFDKGGYWDNLPGPKIDSEGRRIPECQSGCKLQLHGVS